MQQQQAAYEYEALHYILKYIYFLLLLFIYKVNITRKLIYMKWRNYNIITALLFA